MKLALALALTSVLFATPAFSNWTCTYKAHMSDKTTILISDKATSKPDAQSRALKMCVRAVAGQCKKCQVERADQCKFVQCVQ